MNGAVWVWPSSSSDESSSGDGERDGGGMSLGAVTALRSACDERDAKSQKQDKRTSPPLRAQLVRRQVKVLARQHEVRDDGARAVGQVRIFVRAAVQPLDDCSDYLSLDAHGPSKVAHARNTTSRSSLSSAAGSAPWNPASLSSAEISLCVALDAVSGETAAGTGDGGAGGGGGTGVAPSMYVEW